MVKEVDKRGNVRNKTVLYPLPRMTVCYVYHTTLGRFSKVDCSTTKRVPTVPTPNDTSSESSQPDVSNAELVGTDPIPAVDISDHGNPPRRVSYIPSYTVGGATLPQHLPAKKKHVK